MLKNFVIVFRAQAFRPLVGLYKKRGNKLVVRCLGTRDSPASLKKDEPLVLISRNYTKFRKGKGDEQTEINRGQLEDAFDLEELEADFASPVEHFKAQLRREVAPKSEMWHLRNFEFDFEGKRYKVEDIVQVVKDSQGHFILHFDKAPKAVPLLISAIKENKPEWKVVPEGIKIRVQTPKKLTDNRMMAKKMCKSYLTGCREELMMVKYKYLRILGKQDGLSLSAKLELQNQLNMMTHQLMKEAESHLKHKLLELQQEAY